MLENKLGITDSTDLAKCLSQHLMNYEGYCVFKTEELVGMRCAYANR